MACPYPCSSITRINMTFFDKLHAASERHDSLLCVGLDPNPDHLPERYRGASSADGSVDDLLRWNRAIIEATRDLVCAYKPNIAFYEALGLPGQQLLRDTLALIPADVPVLLDAKRGDIGSTAEAYARACFEELGVDAVTLNPYLGRDSIAPFLDYTNKGLFVLCHTSNASAEEFQALEISDWRTLDREPNQPLYLHVARTATSWSPSVGLVVGATYPDALREVREAAPQAWFLVPGIGTQGGDPALLAAGLRDDGLGIIVNASRGVGRAGDHRAAALALREEVNRAREQGSRGAGEQGSRRAREQASKGAGEQEKTRAEVQGNNTVYLNNSTTQSSIFNLSAFALALHDLGAIQFGSFTLASGATSPVYVDLRLLVSQPSLLAEAARMYAKILSMLDFDRICGVPYAALPIGTAVALAANAPLIYTRKEIKQHGLGKAIEGTWSPGERVVMIEDLVTRGGSVLRSVEQLRSLGLVVEEAIVLLDREQGGAENLAAAGVRLHSVAKFSEALGALRDAGKIDESQYEEVSTYLKAKD